MLQAGGGAAPGVLVRVTVGVTGAPAPPLIELRADNSGDITVPINVPKGATRMELSVSGDRHGNTGRGIWGHGNVGIWDVGGVIWDLGTPCTVVSVGPSGGSRTARCPPSTGTAVGDPDGGGVWAVPGAGGSPGVAPSRGRAAAAAAPCGATPRPAALPPPGELQHFCAVLHVLHAVFCVFCVTHCMLHVRCM